MRKPLPLRRLIRGMPCTLLAALVLFARLLAPSMAMPEQADAMEAVRLAGLQAICHAGPEAGGTADHDPAKPPGHGDCQLCPACHLAAQAALREPDGGGLVVAPARALIGLAAPLPPATGPPGRPRLAAQPTGPPASFA